MRLRQRPRRHYEFKPTHRLADGTPVRRVGDPFKVTATGHVWVACEHPDRKLRPERADQLGALPGGTHDQ